MDRALSWFFHVWVALAVAMNLCVLPSLPLRAAEKNTQFISDAIYLKPQRLVGVEPGRRLNVYCLGHGSPTVIFDSGLGVVARVRGGMSKLAKETDISRQGLYKAIANGGTPSFETVMKIVGAFGVRLSAQAAAD
jgi:probable addiction module antidote protein